MKYELYGKYAVLPYERLQLMGGIQQETEEAATAKHAFYHFQYSTEWLRRFSIQRMDYIKGFYIGLETKPLRYTSLSFKLRANTHTPSYPYRYKQRTQNTYQYTDFEIGGRFAFGETYFKLLNAKYRFQSSFPIFWITCNWGLDPLLDFQSDS